MSETEDLIEKYAELQRRKDQAEKCGDEVTSSDTKQKMADIGEILEQKSNFTI